MSNSELKQITPLTNETRNFAEELNIRYKQIENEIDKDRTEITGIKTKNTEQDIKISRLSNPPININGGFDIWQEGTTFSANGANQYTADMWMMRIGALSKVEQIANTCPNSISKYAAKLTLTNSYNGFFTPLENYSNLIGKTVTISLWIKASKKKDIWLFCGDNNITINIEAKWQKIIWTVMPTNTALNERKGFHLVTKTETGHLGDVLEISDVKIEEGEIATPFYVKTVAQTLLECQRYFQDYQITQTPVELQSSKNIYFMLRAVTQMRIIPTVILKGALSVYKASTNGFAETINSMTPVGSSSSPQGVLVVSSIVSTTTMPIYIYKNLSQKIYLDARIY